MKMQNNKTKIRLPEKECVGCSACMAVCAKHCIKMKPDAKGFLRPQIDEGNCISCHSCVRVCQVTNHIEKNLLPFSVLAARTKTTNELNKCSSGGIATLLSKAFIMHGGVIYGAAICEDMVVRHIRVSTVEELGKLSGSKYVQSDISGVYEKMKSDLYSDLPVLFIGTPCQVVAIRKTFHRKSENLYACDLICHSVPSPLLFAEHLKAIESSSGEKVLNYNFRDKSVGGWSYNAHRIFYKSGKSTVHSYWAQCYKRLFLKKLIMRESCYTCQYSSPNRVGDITLGDYWGIRKVTDIFSDNLGVNVVLLNNEKGTYLFNMIKDDSQYLTTSIKDALQKHMIMSCEKTAEVDAFWNYYAQHSYPMACNKYAGRFGYLTLRNIIKDFLVKHKILHV